MQQEDTAKKIKIVKTKEQIKELYPELFEGIGRFSGEPYHICADPSVKPKQTPCRPIPVHLKETFKQEIDTCSPHYSQSNGLAEKFMGIVKNLFYKAKEEGQFPYRALIMYRNTPLCGSLPSPMQTYKEDKLILIYPCHMQPWLKWVSIMHLDQLQKYFT